MVAVTTDWRAGRVVRCKVEPASAAIPVSVDIEGIATRIARWPATQLRLRRQPPSRGGRLLDAETWHTSRVSWELRYGDTLCRRGTARIQDTEALAGKLGRRPAEVAHPPRPQIGRELLRAGAAIGRSSSRGRGHLRAPSRLPVLPAGRQTPSREQPAPSPPASSFAGSASRHRRTFEPRTVPSTGAVGSRLPVFAGQAIERAAHPRPPGHRRPARRRRAARGRRCLEGEICSARARRHQEIFEPRARPSTGTVGSRWPAVLPADQRPGRPSSPIGHQPGPLCRPAGPGLILRRSTRSRPAATTGPCSTPSSGRPEGSCLLGTAVRGQGGLCHPVAGFEPRAPRSNRSQPRT